MAFLFKKCAKLSCCYVDPIQCDPMEKVEKDLKICLPRPGHDASFSVWGREGGDV